MNQQQIQKNSLGSAAAKTGLNLVRTIAAPVLVFLLFLLITSAAGISGFGTGPDLRTIIYNMVYSGLIALAMSYNLTSGRLDFSIGSILILSVIIGGQMTLQYDLGPVAMLLLVAATGLILGTLSGLLYAWLKLPAMVVGLGVAMIYEAIAFSINNSEGVNMIARMDVLIYARMPYNIIVLVAVLIILVYLLNFTKFGYNTRSLQSGQKIAVDVGVNEKRNVVACYALGGALMGCAGILYISQYGIMVPQVGLSSSSFMMGAFLPVFIGGALARYSDRNIGVVMGAFIQATLSSGMVRLGFSSSLQTVVNGAIVLIFLVYTSNSYKFVLNRMYKEKKARALAEH